MRFHCFGCQEDGDVIDFTSKLFGLNLKEAAEKLAHDFGISYDQWKPYHNTQKARPSVIAKLDAAKAYKKKEDICYRVLCDYFHLLQDWRGRYTPQPTDEDWHPLFCEALGKTDYIEYLLDELLSGTYEERAAIVAQTTKMVDELDRRISEIKQTDKDCPLVVFKNELAVPGANWRKSHIGDIAI